MSLNVKSIFHIHRFLIEKMLMLNFLDVFCFDSRMDINPKGEYVRKTANLTQRSCPNQSVALVLFLFDIKK